MTEARLNNFKEARVLFNRAVIADKWHPHAWQSWAVHERNKGNYEVAEKLFRQGLNLTPTHTALWQGYR